ncbi:hypothetical protein HNQ91_000870 [Filimonas zeae]|nr:T9SS type A sorting domain-containing protein [Filimonas zeae]MDR6337848.1 hypothetical protein [Filimonas zeae]
MKTPCLMRLHRRKWYLTVLLVFALIFSAAFSAKAQTALVSGDIAFTGYLVRTSPTADTVSFVVLKASGITAGTEILFTDNGWLPSQVGREGGEGIAKWTAGRDLRYGEQVKMIVSSTPSSDKGTVTRLSGAFDLSTSGDQLFAFTGTWPSPTVLLAGLHYNKNAGTTQQGWDVTSVATGASELSVYPNTLCSTCGVWVRDPNTAQLKTTIGGFYSAGYNATPGVLRGMVNDNANWNNTFSSINVAPIWRLPPAIVLPDTPDTPGGTDTTSTPEPDTSAPYVIAVASDMPDGVYRAGDEINIKVYFNRNVVVNTSAGSPYLLLNVGNHASRAVYVTGSCGSALTFLYTVQPGDTSLKLDYLATDALRLNSGTIQDATAKNATLQLPGRGATLANQRALIINAVAPQVTPFQSFSADRLAAAGTVAGTVKATSKGPVGVVLGNWTIMQGNVQGAFAIHPATGELKVANENALHNPDITGFSLMVTVSDGVNTSAPEEVMVLLREASLEDTIRFTADTLYENRNGAQAGKLALTSGNAGVYSLVAGAGDTDNSLFSISGNTLQTAAALDYEQQQQYHVRVRATLQARYVDTALVIVVHNVNEPPVIDAVANQVVCENAGMSVLPLTGITCGPEGDECVTVAVHTNNPGLFAQLIVIRDSDGTTVLRYKVKDSTSGQALVTITVKDNGGTANGGVDSVTTSFTITAKPAGKVTITAGGNTTLSENESVTLTATAADISGGYQWLLNGQAVTDATAASYKVTAAHPGAYQCSVTSTEGCVATSNIIPVTQANATASLMVFPNPTTGRLSVMFTGYPERYMLLVVHNSAGAEVLRKRIWHGSDTQKDELDLSGFAAGMYIIELITDKGEQVTTTNVIKN